MKHTFIISIITLIVVSLFVSCASTASADGEIIGEGKVKNLLKAGDNTLAAQSVIENKSNYKDSIVYNLDAGVTAFYAGDYQAATGYLSSAEGKIQENKTKSISQGVTSYIVNDNVRDYEGELYEDIIVNIFSALAYYNLGKIEDAMVEVRRANIKLVDYEINVKKQEAGLYDLVMALTPNPFQYLPTLENIESYNYSPLATYISMLMYNLDGDSDNATVDFNKIVSRSGSIVSKEDIAIPKGKGRLNVISFEGLISPKVEKSETGRYAISGKTVSHKIAWPWISNPEGTAVSRVYVKVGGQTVTLTRAEDFSQDALETLNMDLKSTYLRSFYRGLTKMTTAVNAAIEADKASTSVTSSISSALIRKLADSSVDKAINKAVESVNESEKADTRMCNYLPDQASIGGITLDPGTYTAEVVYELNNGKAYSRSFEVKIKEGKNTIITSSCAR